MNRENLINITTPVQAGFHLRKGEIVCFDIDDANCYIKLDGEELKLIVQPIFGSGTEFTGDINMLSNLMDYVQKEGVRFYVIVGMKLIGKKFNILDKLFNWLSRKTIDK